MPKTMLSTKGQVVIPKEIRQRHRWKSGTALEIEDRGDCIVLRVVKSLPRTTIDDLIGCLPYSGSPKTLEEMEAGIAQGAKESR